MAIFEQFQNQAIYLIYHSLLVVNWLLMVCDFTEMYLTVLENLGFRGRIQTTQMAFQQTVLMKNRMIP